MGPRAGPPPTDSSQLAKVTEFIQKTYHQSEMNDPVVTVKQGALRGIEVESAIGGSYIAFKGIPYAKPPVGDLRFRDPQPPQSWTGIRNAVTEGSKAAQIDVITGETVGDDDCLYLNVATTSLTGSRPVMFWIHGGAFVWGSGSFEIFSPDYLMGSEVVYVSINYRLGVLGFLHLDHEVAPGNMGLKDQVAALKWVKENIAQFGGDPNNVTVFGHSCGGSSAHYLLHSPLAKGLFHKAIMQSGVMVNPFAFTLTTTDMAHRYVAALGKNTTDPNEIVEYLRTIPAHRLIAVQRSVIPVEDRLNLVLAFGPGVDNKSVEPFMPRPHRELVEKGFEIPLIIGYTSAEGIFFLKGRPDEAYSMLDGNFEAGVLRGLAGRAINKSKVPEIAKDIRKFYFGDKPITKDMVDEFVQCYGDMHFVAGIHEVLEIQREKKSLTYFYKFSYDSPASIAKSIFQVKGRGAMHTEEFHYLFYAAKFRDQIRTKLGPTDQVLRDKLVRMWTDFAKTGNPTPSIDDLITKKWEPVTKTTKNYLEIDAEFTTGVNPDQNVWDTWQRIYKIADDQ